MTIIPMNLILFRPKVPIQAIGQTTGSIQHQLISRCLMIGHSGFYKVSGTIEFMALVEAA